MTSKKWPAAFGWVGTGVVEAEPTSIEFEFDDGAGGYDAVLNRYGIQIGTTYSGSDIYGNFVLGETGGISGSHVVYDMTPHSPLPVGQTIYIRARGRNDDGNYGAIGYTTLFIKSPPDAPTLVSPTSTKPYAKVANLQSSHAIWSSSEGEMEVQATYSHPDGYGPINWEIEINGVSEVIPSPTPDGAGVYTFHPAENLPRNTNRSFRMRVQAVGGQWSAWTGTFNTKINWAQGIYEHNHGSGASSFEFAHGTLSGGSWAQAAYLFRKSNGTPGPWKETVGEVTPGTHMQVLVRLASGHGSQNPSLPDMTLSWATVTEPVPDDWTATGATIAVDATLRRFGRRSIRVVPSGTGRVTNRLNGGLIPVTVGVQYTLSMFVHTLGVDLGTDIFLRALDSDGNTILDGTGDALTSDSSAYDDGWQRLVMTFVATTPTVEVGIGWTGTPTEFRMDSAQLEEGPRATQWRPGAAGQAVSLDVGGVQVDASLGGIFRLRGSTGGSRDLVTLGSTGLEFADVMVDSPSAGRLRVQGDLEVTGEVLADFSGCRVYRTTTQSIGDGSPTAVSFSTGNATEDYDTDAYHDLTTNPSRLTAPVAGYYAISGGCEFASDVDGARSIYFSVTDITGPTTTIHARARHINLVSAGLWLSISDIVFLDAGDYVELTVLHNAGNSLNIGNSDRSTFLAIARLGV